MGRGHVFPVFSAAFAVLYVLCMYNNIALFTYFPRTREFAPLTSNPTPTSGPGMYWYGWIALSTIGAALVASIAAWVPRSISARVWSGWTWVAPLAVMFVFAYLLRGWFIRLK